MDKKWEYKLLVCTETDFDQSRERLKSEGWTIVEGFLRLPPDMDWAIIFGRPEPSAPAQETPEEVKNWQGRIAKQVGCPGIVP